ncbi:MAG: hypothetical protein R3A50_15040 [Saprospiraceae bacterium]|nr:hypothetical protein [Lewinellaceae bacterium]
MTKTSINLPRRYPGLRPFERSQQAVFHGRQEDVQRLSNLILRERLVVLFAKSGIGKTSLLQAGVAPELERHDYVPIMLRTERSDKMILDSLDSILRNTPHVSGRNTTGERPGKHVSLWEQMKRLEFDLKGLPATPVLVFDQFEETFTLSHAEISRRQFLTELADLANGTMPEDLRSDLLQSFQSGEIDMETMRWWEETPDVRIVLSIRSDFLHMIDGMSDIIPGILKNRYQLLPLNREKAQTAIVMPARAAGEFSSPIFQYSEEALSEMIDFLAGNMVEGKDDREDDNPLLKKKDEIEAVNLQIVCMDVEEKIIDYQQAAEFEVTPPFYDGKEGLKSSIRNFYANQLDNFPKAYIDRIQQKSQQFASQSEQDLELIKMDVADLRELARRLIEESLITPGNRRNSVVDDTLLDEYDVTIDFLNTLVDKSRLLRKEPRLDDFYYEISHDTLLPAIIESRNKRRYKEEAEREKAAYEARIAEEAARREEVEKELRATRRQRRMARIAALTSTITLLVSMAFGAWFIRDYINSSLRQLRAAERNVYIEQYDAALNGYDELLQHENRVWILRNSTPPKEVADEKAVAETLNVAYRHSILALSNADSLMFTDNYAEALTAYRAAIDETRLYHTMVTENLLLIPGNKLVPRVDTSLIMNRLRLLENRRGNALKILIREFKISQKDYEVFNEAEVWGQALTRLQQMQDILPEHPEDQHALQDELQLNTPISQYLDQKLDACKRKLR